VTVTAPDCFGIYFLADRILQLFARYPDLSVKILSFAQTTVLSRREADIAITFERPSEGRLTVQKIADFSSGLFASSAFVRSLRPVKSLSDLIGYTYITTSRENKPRAGEEEAALERLAGRRLECSSIAGQLRAIQAGAGFGVLPRFAARCAENLERILPQMSFSHSYWAVTHVDLVDVRRVKEVQRFIASTSKANAKLLA
jgi:DNA-binding transcriptional LysR family regulator